MAGSFNHIVGIDGAFTSSRRAAQMTRPCRKPRIEEGQCPECLRWSLVAYDGSLPPGGFWWGKLREGAGAGCPECGAVVLVESECTFAAASVSVCRAALRHGSETISSVLAEFTSRTWHMMVGP